MDFLTKPKVALLFCLIAYSLVIFFTYSQTVLPAGVDAATHMFQIWLFQNEGFTSWNHWWYTGNPQLDQYPPLSHFIPSLFSGFLGVELSYKLTFSLIFILLPLSFYLLLEEFKLSDSQKSIAILFFSFSAAFIHFFQGAVFSFMFSIPFLILHFKFLLRFINSNKIIHGLVSTSFLSFALLTHLFSPIGMTVLIFIYLLVYNRTSSTFKKFLSVGALSALIVSFFWIPLFLNYNINSGSSSLSFISILIIFIESIGRSLFSYFNIFSLLLLCIFGAILLFSFYEYYKKKKNLYLLFIILLILIPILISLTPFGSNFKSRIPLLYPIFFSLLIGEFYGLDKKINYLIYAMLFGMFIIFITHPIYSVSDDMFSMAEWATSNSESRVLFLPQGFGMLTEWSGNPSAYEYLFSTYLLPINGKEVYNGWFGEFAPHSEKDESIMFHCTNSKSISDLFSTISLFDNTILASFDTCKIPEDKALFCKILQEGAVDTVFVNSLFSEVVSYAQDLPCLEEFGNYKTLIGFNVKNPKPYVDNGFDYSKNSEKISIDIQGSYTRELVVRESYYPYWKAHLDGQEIAVKESEYNFLSIPLSVGNGSHELLLEYAPQRYSHIFEYLSFFSIIVSLTIVFNKKLQKQIETSLFTK